MTLVVKETGASYGHILCRYWNHFDNYVREVMIQNEVVVFGVRLLD